jgi:hypothetical protein
MGRFRLGSGCAAVIAAAGMFASTGAQAATVTVGSPLTATFDDDFGGPVTDVNVALPEAGAIVVSPVNGTIVSWRVIVGGPGGLAIRVIEPAAAGAYRGGGTSPATASATGTQTFSASLPIKAGDLIGLDIGSATVLNAPSVPGAIIKQWQPPLADGASLVPRDTFNGSELGYNADVRYCLVPKLKGKKLGAARLALSQAACTVGTLRRPKKGKAKFVKSQGVPPGTALADGAAVDLKLRRKLKKK